jgi:hypothetical protein
VPLAPAEHPCQYRLQRIAEGLRLYPVIRSCGNVWQIQQKPTEADGHQCGVMCNRRMIWRELSPLRLTIYANRYIVRTRAFAALYATEVCSDLM